MKRYFLSGIFVGFGITEFMYFITYAMKKEVIDLVILIALIAFWILIMVFDILSFAKTHKLRMMSYHSIDIKCKINKEWREFKNITNYKVDNFGDITFYDEIGNLYPSVSKWKLISHS